MCLDILDKYVINKNETYLILVNNIEEINNLSIFSKCYLYNIKTKQIDKQIDYFIVLNELPNLKQVNPIPLRDYIQ